MDMPSFWQPATKLAVVFWLYFWLYQFDVWNSLHNWVVSANATDTFKAILDKF